MRLGRIFVVLALAFTTGCAGVGVAPYTLVLPGAVKVGTLVVDADAGWNASNHTKSLFNESGGAAWTRDGFRLNKLVIVPDVADGAPIFKEPKKEAVYPRFHADMLPNEITTLVESSLTKSFFGEGEALVTSSNLRPAAYGGAKGFAFDVAVSVSEGPDWKGTVGGFVADGRLNLVMYLAAVPYYYDKDRARAEAAIASARRATAT